MANRRTCTLLLFGTALLGATLGPGQSPDQPKEDRSAWKRTAKPLVVEPADPARRARIEKWDRRFDELMNSTETLEQRSAEGIGYGIAPPGYVAEPEDLPVRPELSIVVAKFEAYQMHLSHTHRSLYTEITMRVERSLYPGPTLLAPGSTVTLLEDGGTVQLPDGRVLSISESYNPSGFRPGHRYLLFLRYETKYDHFLVTRCWELRNGLVKATEYYDLNRSVAPGFAGMSEAAFLQSVQKTIAERLTPYK